jgi:hypothetical protein
MTWHTPGRLLNSYIRCAKIPIEPNQSTQPTKPTDRRWQLPEQPWHSNAHCVLLQQMQQLVELKESVRVMYDISTVSDPISNKGGVTQTGRVGGDLSCVVCR